MGTSVRVDLTFDPGDLGHINILDPCKGTYIRVPALDQAYASRLSLWQHKVIRRYAQQQLNDRTDIVALAQAKADIRALVERDFHRKSTCGRKRHARFLTDHTTAAAPEAMPIPPAIEVQANHVDKTAARDQQALPQPAVADGPNAARSDFFTDDDILPVFEANLDLPQLSAMAAASERNTSVMEDA
jgi:putative transposase